MTNEVTKWASQVPDLEPVQAVAPIVTHAPAPADPRSTAPAIPRDVALSAADRRIADSFATAMAGAPQQFIDQALRWYASHAAETDTDREHVDLSDKRQAIAAMRAEWGSMYGQNMRALHTYFDALPHGVQQALENAELDDGCLLLNSPVGIRWLFDLARAPMLSAPAMSPADELQRYQQMMADQRSEYWRGSTAARHQARYAYLLSQAQQGNSTLVRQSGMLPADERAKLIKMSANQHGPYWRGPLADQYQARLRELIEQGV